jgi:SAM-dependent methyltransferase
MTDPTDNEPLPDYLFTRQDGSADELFYAEPRFVTHIDNETIEAITGYYRDHLKSGDAVLDLMSSWISHLPSEIAFSRVAGLGMNEEELAANPRLDDWVVHDLNQQPVMPYDASSFDAVMIVVSIQYLTKPQDVFEEILRTLKPGGKCIVAMSHRLFPTKAIYAFTSMAPPDRFNFVRHTMTKAGFTDINFDDRSPESADPCWIISGNKTNSEA